MQPGELKAGQWGRIVAVDTIPSPYRSRLISLGLLPGTRFQVIRVAPLGDPFEIAVRGSSLILRRHEAAILTVEPVCVK